jgi:hypothetical protein
MATCAIPVNTESAIIYSTGDLREGEFVQFRLLYSGNQLTANGTPSDKHAVRREFHGQLKRLWFAKPRLHSLARVYGGIPLRDAGRNNFTDDEAINAYFAQLGRAYERGNFHFVPLVEESLQLNVNLDILFLRPDDHPLIQQGGDLDNRLKTLFDSLRVPDSTNGLGGRPEQDEEPFFVLLQDDRLITEFKVSTDTLLMLPHHRAFDPKDALLVIDVKLTIRERTAKGMALE